MRWTALIRQILRFVSVVWLLLSLFIAYGRLEVWPTTRDIGAGVVADCTRSAFSEVPQLLLSALGFFLLARVANGPMPVPRRQQLHTAITVLFWVIAVLVVPLPFPRNCVN